MPLVCIERPNRTYTRHWTPRALTRIVRDVCERYGQREVEQAVKAGLCEGELECEKVALAVLEWAIWFLAIMEALEILLGIAESRWLSLLKLILKRIPGVNVLVLGLELLRGLIPRAPGSAADLAGLVEKLREITAVERLPSP